MSENTSLVLETAQSHLDENENPPLSDATIGNTSDILTDTVPEIQSIVTEGPDVSLPLKGECLTPSKNAISDSGYQCDILENGNGLADDSKSSSECLNNNSSLTNGSIHDADISSIAPDLNFMENSNSLNEENANLLCSALSELNLSNGVIHSALSEKDTTIDNHEVTAFLEEIVVSETELSLPSNSNEHIKVDTSAMPEESTLENIQPSSFEDRPILSELDTVDFDTPGLSMPVDTEHTAVESDIPGFSIPVDTEHTAVESGQLELFPTCEDNFEGEEFQDAVQFFKDPSSIQFLENIKTSDQAETFLPRDSLYMKFDPLHKDFISPLSRLDILRPPSDTKTAPSESGIEKLSDVLDIDQVPNAICKDDLALVNKHLSNVPERQSFDNILISFDSPMKSNSARNSQKVASPVAEVPKMYTEDELQQAIKINELTIQDVYLKKQREMEEENVKKAQEKDAKIKQLSLICGTLQVVVQELADVTSHLQQKNEVLSTKITEVESEKQKLDDDLKASAEDLQSVEHTFSDFHKRYEQCKGMLKTYKDNEEHLKQQIEGLNKTLEEQEQMYNMLQMKTEEMVSKANTEVASAKKGGDTQIAVLRAQLKKSELRVSSLESDLKQVRIENDKLSGICDDLMAKVSES